MPRTAIREQREPGVDPVARGVCPHIRVSERERSGDHRRDPDSEPDLCAGVDDAGRDAAGVGVDTVYRRFGDRAGLVAALMDERERRLQDAILTGPPPLGPGAPPVERIKAFLGAYVDLLDAYAPLMAVAESTMSPARRYGSGAYAVHHRHLQTLIEQARPEADAGFLAHALLAPLAASLFVYQRRQLGLTAAEIAAGFDALLASWR